MIDVEYLCSSSKHCKVAAPNIWLHVHNLRVLFLDRPTVVMNKLCFWSSKKSDVYDFSEFRAEKMSKVSTKPSFDLSFINSIFFRSLSLNSLCCAHVKSRLESLAIKYLNSNPCFLVFSLALLQATETSLTEVFVEICSCTQTLHIDTLSIKGMLVSTQFLSGSQFTLQCLSRLIYLWARHYPQVWDKLATFYRSTRVISRAEVIQNPPIKISVGSHHQTESIDLSVTNKGIWFPECDFFQHKRRKEAYDTGKPLRESMLLWWYTANGASYSRNIFIHSRDLLGPVG